MNNINNFILLIILILIIILLFIIIILTWQENLIGVIVKTSLIIQEIWLRVPLVTVYF